MASEQTSSRIFSLLGRIPSIIGSLFFAVLIWFFVAMTKRYTAAASLPVVIKSEGSKQTVKNEFSEKVEVKFEVEGWKILSLYLGQYEWQIDLSNELQKDALVIETLPKASEYIKPSIEGMKILEVDPEEIDLELAEQVKKRVPIKLKADLQAKAGYILRPPFMLQPDSVTLSGAKNILDSIRFWETVAEPRVDLTNEFKFELELDDTLKNIVKRSVSKITVRGAAEQLSETEFADIPVTIIKAKRPIYVTLIPNRVKLTLSGAVNDLAKVKAESLAVFVDSEKLIIDTTGFVSPIVKFPKGLNLLRASPEKLQYILRN